MCVSYVHMSIGAFGQKRASDPPGVRITSIHELPSISTETQTSFTKVQLPTTLHYADQENWGVFGDLFYPNNRSMKSYAELKKGLTTEAFPQIFILRLKW